jgi:hypothetical protein
MQLRLSSPSRPTARPTLGAALALLLAVLGGCGDDGEAVAATVASTTSAASATTSAPSREIPSPERLAASLVTVEDLGGLWSVASDLLSGGAVPGVVTDEVRGQLPSLSVCPEAGAEASVAAAAVEWHAFTILERPGGTPEQPIVLGEFLSAGDPADIEADFGLVRDGTLLCAGIERPAEGDATETAEVILLPGVGDDRFAVRAVTSDGEMGSYLWGAFVRTGGVFMFLDVWEVTSGEPATTTDEFIAILTAAVERLP